MNFRFCNGSEVSLDHSIIPPLNDDVQLSVSEYRNKLYELIANGKHLSKSHGTTNKLVKNKSASLEYGKKSKEFLQKKMSKYIEGRINGGVLKETVHKTTFTKHRSHKNHSVEELRDKCGTSNPVIATKSEPSQKTGNIRNFYMYKY